MGRYLVLAPAGLGDELLLEELGRLAAGGASHFHVLVPCPTGGDTDLGLAARRRLATLLDALAGRGLDGDGEVGEGSVIGSVARATERTHYDALVVPIPGIGMVDTLDLEVARRLHQIDVPHLDIVTPHRTQPVGARAMMPPRPADRRGLVVGAILVLILAFVVAVLVSERPSGRSAVSGVSPPKPLGVCRPRVLRLRWERDPVAGYEMHPLGAELPQQPGGSFRPDSIGQVHGHEDIALRSEPFVTPVQFLAPKPVQATPAGHDFVLHLRFEFGDLLAGRPVVRPVDRDRRRRHAAVGQGINRGRAVVLLHERRDDVEGSCEVSVAL